MKDFRDKVAVITGAASGIGAGIARRAAQEGARLVLADVDTPQLAAVAKELQDAGAEVVTAETDVRDPAQVDRLADRAFEVFGGVHLVFNNAGVMVGGYAWDCTNDDWRWVLDVNLFGVVHGVKSFVPRLLSQNEPAHVVNTASVGGILSGPFLSPYIVSKHAVVALTESIYYELQARGGPVAVSCLCPGPIATGISSSERIRPDDRPDRHRDPSEVERAFDAGVTAGISGGMNPDDVGPIVFDALRDDRFWIFTHEGMHVSGVQQRANSIVTGTNPVGDDGLAQLVEENAGGALDSKLS